MNRSKTELNTTDVRRVDQLILALLGPYADFVVADEQSLTFGGKRSARSSKRAGVFLVLVALLTYYVILTRLDGWIWRALLALLSTLIFSAGIFFFRYKRSVILSQETREVIVDMSGRRHVFASFSDVKHFKNTEHRHRGHYRATSLSLVLKDDRELRLITYKESKVQADFPKQINLLLWKWLNGRTTL